MSRDNIIINPAPAPFFSGRFPAIDSARLDSRDFFFDLTPEKERIHNRSIVLFYFSRNRVRGEPPD